MLGTGAAPEIRAFNSTVTACTPDRKWSWRFKKGDRVTNIIRIGGKVRFDAGDNVATRGTFEMELIPFELATKQKVAPESEEKVNAQRRDSGSTSAGSR